jgi:hypothetical protein
MHTCRKDDPGLPKPVLEMMLESMYHQRFAFHGDCELIIVDLLWEKRHEWFVELVNQYQQKYPEWEIPVLHVPDRPTPFRDEKLLRISSPKNTGILLARGTHVVFTDDCQVLPLEGLLFLADWAKYDTGATTCYEKRIYNPEGSDHVTGRDRRGVHLKVPDGTTRLVQARDLGFLGGTMSMLPLETLLDLNGWDEGFDGSRQLEDGDMIMRLAAYGQQMAYENRIKVTEYEVGAYDEDVVNTTPIKCNGAYSSWRWKHLQIQANRGYDDETIRRMDWRNCIRLVENEKCSPHKAECIKFGGTEQLERIFKDPRLVFDLREERKSISWETALKKLR